MHTSSDPCPLCDSARTESVNDDVLRCRDCGAYFDSEDDLEGSWDRSSRHKTRMDDGYDFDE